MTMDRPFEIIILSNTLPWCYHSVHIGKHIPSGRGQMCPPPK